MLRIIKMNIEYVTASINFKSSNLIGATHIQVVPISHRAPTLEMGI